MDLVKSGYRVHQTGPVLFVVQLSDCRKRCVHRNQVRKCILGPDLVPEPEVTDEVLPVPCTEDQPASVEQLLSLNRSHCTS